MIGGRTARLRNRLRARDGDLCAICGKRMRFAKRGGPYQATIDHIVPRSRGGSNDMTNLRLAHKLCNNTRGNGTAQEHGPTQREAAAAREVERLRSIYVVR